MNLQQISNRFGGSLPSVNKLASSSGGQKISDKLHTVHVKVSFSGNDLNTRKKKEWKCLRIEDVFLVSMEKKLCTRNIPG